MCINPTAFHRMLFLDAVCLNSDVINHWPTAEQQLSVELLVRLIRGMRAMEIQDDEQHENKMRAGANV